MFSFHSCCIRLFNNRLRQTIVFPPPQVYNTALQSQKTVAAYSKSKQLLHFVFERQYRVTSEH